MALLSIIIPVYNAEEMIARTLESLEKIPVDSRKVVELFIIDDGSTDSSVSVAESKATGLTPMKVVLIRQKNCGPSAARNAALKEAKGEWVFFLDSDDELAFDPIPYIERSSDSTALAFQVIFKKRSEVVGRHMPSMVNLLNHMDVFTAENAVTISSMIFKKDCIEEPFDEECRQLEDWLFWIKNPEVFRAVSLFKDTPSAVVHAHGLNRSSNYALSGEYRDIIAKRILKESSRSLTKKQKNNLIIQSQIGVIMQGKRASLKTFLRFPCSLKLYAKFFVYRLLKHRFHRIDFYGR